MLRPSSGVCDVFDLLVCSLVMDSHILDSWGCLDTLVRFDCHFVERKRTFWFSISLPERKSPLTRQ